MLDLGSSILSSTERIPNSLAISIVSSCGSNGNCSLISTTTSAYSKM